MLVVFCIGQVLHCILLVFLGASRLFSFCALIYMLAFAYKKKSRCSLCGKCLLGDKEIIPFVKDRFVWKMSKDGAFLVKSSMVEQM